MPSDSMPRRVYHAVLVVLCCGCLRLQLPETKINGADPKKTKNKARTTRETNRKSKYKYLYTARHALMQLASRTKAKHNPK